MNVTFVYRFCLCPAFILFANLSLFAQLDLYLSDTNRWSTTVLSTDVTEAGSDFQGTYTSNSDEKELNVEWDQRQSAGFYWHVSVRKVDSSWDDTLPAKIYVQRTGDGTKVNWGSSGAYITGGTSYLQITDTYQSFFSGYKGWDYIPIQYQLRNVSVVMPVRTYRTTIYYTLASP